MLFSPSSKAHLSLMLCGLMAAAGVSLFLVAGWRWHFAHVQQRQELARLSQATEQRYMQMAADRAGPGGPGGLALSVASPGDETAVSALKASHMTLAQVGDTEEENSFPQVTAPDKPVSAARRVAARETLLAFFKATRWQDKVAYVADPERVKPLMQSWYDTQKHADPEPGELSFAGHFQLNHTDILHFASQGPSAGERAEMAMVAPVGGGAFLLDWESYAGTGDLSWQDFKQQRPAVPHLFRLYLRRDSYYNYEFADDSRYLAFHLGSPDGVYFVFGYCEKESVVGQTLLSLLHGTNGRLPLTLRLAYPPSAQSDHCVKIVGVVANRWLVVK